MLRGALVLLAVLSSSAAFAGAADDMRICASDKGAPAVEACGRVLGDAGTSKDHGRALDFRARALSGQGLYRDAISDYNRLVDVRGPDPDVLALRGFAWLQIGYYNKCIVDYNSALERRPASAAWYLWRGRCLLGNDEASKALDDYKTAIRLNPGIVSQYDINRYYAMAVQAMGETETAADFIARAIDRNPLDYSSYVTGYLVAIGRGDANAALIYLSQAVEAGAVADGSWELHLQRGIVYRLQKRYGAALLELKYASDRQPQSARILMEKAITHAAMGDRGLASTELEMVVTRYPPEAVAFDERGRVYVESSKLDLAIENFDKALAMAPNSKLYLSDRGDALLRKGDLDGAQADFDRVLSQDDHYVAALAGRARLAEIRGEIPAARNGYKAVVDQPLFRDFEPLQAFKAEADRRLAALPAPVQIDVPAKAIAEAGPLTPPLVSPRPDNDAKQAAVEAAKPVEAPKTVAIEDPKPPAAKVPKTVVAPPVAAKDAKVSAFEAPKPILPEAPKPVLVDPPKTVVETPGLVTPTDPVRQAAFQMLDKHCSRCHQTDKTTDLTKAQTRLAKVLDLDALALNKKYVTPGRPELSTLYFTVFRREMPYDVYQEGATNKPRPTDAELSALRAWVISLDPKVSVAKTDPPETKPRRKPR